MKNIVEALFSLLALYLFSVAIAAAIVLGMLLIPVVFISLFVMAMRQLISWKRGTHKSKQSPAVKVEGQVIAISSWTPQNRNAA